MKRHSILSLTGILSLLILFVGCKKTDDTFQPATGLIEQYPTIKLWPLPSNHPPIGDSIKIRIISTNTDSIKINGELMEVTEFSTGPVISIQKYVGEAYGYGKVAIDSVLVIPM